MRFITAIPVYNEQKYLDEVLQAARSWSPELLVVDDGSTDATPELLRNYPDVQVLRHTKNEGYGASLRDAFRFAVDQGYDVLVTMDCDGQHEPKRIPELLARMAVADIVSGSRYLSVFPGDSLAPEPRRRINMEITRVLNERLGLGLTDAFCGFKAYRCEALRKLEVTDTGYAMPLQVWAQAAYLGLRIVEVPVPLIYLDETRAFGGALDDADRRLAHYYEVLNRSIRAVQDRGLVLARDRRKRASSEDRVRNEAPRTEPSGSSRPERCAGGLS